MIKPILFLLAAVYLYRITSSFTHLLNVRSCLKTVGNFVCTAVPSRYGPVDKSDKFSARMYAVLKKYPRIHQLVTYPTLSYSQSEDNIYTHTVTLYNELLMVKNYARHGFFQSLSPLNAVKNTLSLPSAILRFIGFKPKESTSRILNLICWFIAYLLNLYGPELKAFIDSFFQSL